MSSAICGRLLLLLQSLALGQPELLLHYTYLALYTIHVT